MSKPRLIASLLAVTGLLTLTARVAVRAFPLQSPPSESTKGASQEASQHQDEDNVATVENQDLKLEHGVEPVYPPLAKMARIQGNVVLKINVEANGEVSDIKVRSGHPLLVKAALEAVSRWRFESSPILPTTTSVTLRFRLPEPNPEGKVSGVSVVEPKRANYPDVSIIIRGPHYPEEAKRQHIEGQVALEVMVDQDGNISDTHVLKSDHEVLTEAALNALHQPPYIARHLRPGLSRVVVDFSLRERDAKLTHESVLPPGDM